MAEQTGGRPAESPEKRASRLGVCVADRQVSAAAETLIEKIYSLVAWSSDLGEPDTITNFLILKISLR